MKRLHLWWIAGAMATVMGCGDNGGTTGIVITADVPGDTADDTTPTPDTAGDTTPTPDTIPTPDTAGDTVPTPDTPQGDGGVTCNAGQTSCSGVCVDLMADNANCGACGTTCTGTQACQAGHCGDVMMCASGQQRCGGTCVDTASDNNNCGACGNACPTGQSCTGGTCATATPCAVTGQTRCGGTCTDTMTDAANCATCGHACMAGQSCAAGACVAAMPCAVTGQTRCGGTCTDTMTDLANCGTCGTACPTGQVCTAGACGTGTCPTGQTRCGSACVNIVTDIANCGMCGRACATGQTCSASTCMGAVVCPTGQMMCGSACADVNTDPMNCGSCGHACTAGQTCAAGACATPRTCPTGQTDCTPTGTTMTCFDLQTSSANCGSCGNACATGQTCTAGACACATGTRLCGRACVNTMTDSANCGACGTACPTGRSCAAGVCACPTGQTTCAGACANTMTDAANCGSCGHACATGQTCTGGVCGCPTGQMLCGAACANTATDRANCGMCGHACTTGQTCAGGVCGCPTGQVLCAGLCANTMTDAANCGACGTRCMAGTSCTGGMCRGTPPGNDTRTGATAIDLSMPAVTLSADTAAARNDTVGSCGCTNGNDVFFRFALTQPEVVYADTLGTTWDTSLFIQNSTGANVTDASTVGGLACDDDNGFCSSGLQSQILLRLPAGTYYLVLSGCGAGASQIHFQHLPAGNGPAVHITPGATVQTATGTTAGVGTVTSTCCSGGPDNAYWWITCPNTAAASFYASGCNPSTGVNLAAYDTEIAQYSALRPGVGSQVCNDDTGFVCFRGSSLNSTVPTTAANQAGLNTMIADSCSGAGAYTINYILGNCGSGARCGMVCADTTSDVNNCGGCDRRCPSGQNCVASACVVGPANDHPAGAVIINMAAPSSTFSVNTTNAVNDTAGSCGCTGGRDVFYNFTIAAGQSEIVYADTIGSPFDTSLFVQTSAGTNITATNLPTSGVACNDDGGFASCGIGLQSQIMLRLDAGAYRLVLSGCGAGAASLRFHHLPVGNGSVAFLGAGSSAPGGTTSGTGRVTGSCSSGGPESTYYWATCQTSTGGMFTASTCGRASYDTSLHQSSAARTTPGVNVCNDDSCGLQSSVTSIIPAGAGLHTFYVDSFSAGGTYTVAITRP